MIRTTRVMAALACALGMLGQMPLQSAAGPSWMEVGLAGAREHLSSLAAEARVEQLRDWALLAAYMQTEDPAERPQGLMAFQPLRLDFLADLVNHRVGATRWITLHNGDLLVALPETMPERLVEIGRVADEYRAIHGVEPKRALPFLYRLDAAATRLDIARLEEIAGPRLFSSEAGFREARLDNQAQLDAFLAANLDLVTFRLDGPGARVAGRAHARGTPRLVKLADLAILKDADRDLEARVRSELEKQGLREEYETRVDEAVANAIAAHPEALTLFSTAELKDEAHRRFPYSTFLRDQIDAVMQQQPPSLGFSLDPRINYPEIATALRGAARGDAGFVDWFKTEVSEEVAKSRLFTEARGQAFVDRLVKAQASTAHTTDREISLASLLGLPNATSPSASASGSATAPSAASSRYEALQRLFRDPRSLAERVESVMTATTNALRKNAAELNRVAAALDAQDVEPLLQLRRYFNGDAAAVAINAKAPGYRIRDLQELLTEAKLTTPTDGKWVIATGDAVRAFQQRSRTPVTGVVDEQTWKALLKAAPQKAEELNRVALFLQLLGSRHNYQCARYDGDFQGTEVGMTLFYTDLVMKLWGFSNKAQAPAVEGFVPKTQFEVSPLYWDDIEHNSSTRSWLSGRLESVTLRDDGRTLIFAPVATRIYNASSNPLYPGEEVAANYMSQRFSTWWNYHYREVADYEPQYHRLNQLMKWSAVMQSLGSRNPTLLTRLKAPDEPRNLRFDSWWKGRPDLKVHWDLAFLAPASEPTECLAMVESELFDVTGRVASLSGGVSLFDRVKLSTKATIDRARLAIRDPRLRMPGVDFSKIKVPDQARELPYVNGDTLVMGGKCSFEFRPATQTLNGTQSALASPSVVWSAERAGEGMSIAVRESRGRLANLVIEPATNGMSVRVEESAVTSAVRLLGPTRAREAASAVPIGVPNGDVYVRHLKDKSWAVASSAKNTSAADSGIRIAYGRDIALVRATDANTVNKAAGGWLRVTSSPRSAQMIAESVDSAPPGATVFMLETSGGRVNGMLHEGHLYIERGQSDLGDIIDRVAQTSASLPTAELRALQSAGAPRLDAMIWRDGEGRLVAGRFNGVSGPITPFQDWLPTSGQGVRGVQLATDAGGGVSMTRAGFLRLPAAADSMTIDLARRVAGLANRRPSLATELHRLPQITSHDLTMIESLSEPRSISYMDMRALRTDELGRAALAEMTFTAEDPRILYRVGDDVVSIDVPDTAAVFRARQAAEQAMAGEAPARQWSIAEFRNQTRPYYELIERMRKTTSGRVLVSLEGDGKLNMETFYRMHGGNQKFRIMRDIPNLALSVRHVATAPVLRLQRSVVLSTAPLDTDPDPRFARVRQQAATLRSTLIDMRASIKAEDFFESLNSEYASQITLIARCRDNGLVFADRWVSAEELADATEEIEPKDYLHLVTDCGMSIVHTFADTGRFSRVLSTRFETGDPASLERALQAVTQLTTSYVTSTKASWTKEEFERARAIVPQFQSALASVSKVKRDRVEIDGGRLLALLQKQGVDLASRGARALMAAVRERVPHVRDMTIDRGIDQINKTTWRGKDLNVRNASTELASVTQAKYD